VGEKSVSIPTERIEKAILLIRDQKVMIDRDLAELYGVKTRVLNQSVRRNISNISKSLGIDWNCGNPRGERFERWYNFLVT